MTDRFSPSDLFRGHRKVLTLRSPKSTRTDWVAVGGVYAFPLAVGGAAWYFDFPISSPDGLLGGLALLSGGLLAAFAQIAAWRERLGARAHLYEQSEDSDREALDEVVTHVLVASFWSVLGVVVIALGQGIKPEKDGSLVGVDCGIVAAVVTHVAVLFMLVIFKLNDSYMYVNKVNDRVNGSVRQ